MKNVLLVTPRYYPDMSAGGSTVGCMQLVKSLVSNYKVTIATLNTVNVPCVNIKIDNALVIYFSVNKIF